MHAARGNRESGANPERSRHCIRGASFYQCHLMNNQGRLKEYDDPKARRPTFIYAPRNLRGKERCTLSLSTFSFCLSFIRTYPRPIHKDWSFFVFRLLCMKKGNLCSLINIIIKSGCPKRYHKKTLHNYNISCIFIQIKELHIVGIGSLVRQVITRA
ncbi:hypothetical protein SAMN04487897_103231 [Paenibacillus sp. yr247]|nr:hypothetical protein SAMN04487897_103231 [Paenibacillus sp. yr247]